MIIFIDLDKKIATLAAKTEQDKIAKLGAFDSSYFRAKNYFENYITQKYLVFQPIY